MGMAPNHRLRATKQVPVWNGMVAGKRCYFNPRKRRDVQQITILPLRDVLDLQRSRMECKAYIRHHEQILQRPPMDSGGTRNARNASFQETNRMDVEHKKTKMGKLGRARSCISRQTLPNNRSTMA